MVSKGFFMIFLSTLHNIQETESKYVYVKADGTVRELTPDEDAYLREVFHRNDGARPYIKHTYDQLTPDGKIWGFLAKKNVPQGIEITKG